MGKQYPIRKNGRTYIKTRDEIREDVRIMYLQNGKSINNETLDWVTEFLIWLLDDEIPVEAIKKYIM